MIKTADKKKAKLIAIQMDAFSNTNPQTDSTLLLALELQRRGYQLFFYEPRDLQIINAKVWAHGFLGLLHDQPSPSQIFYSVVEKLTLALETTLLVMIRQNPPFDIHYITTTYILDLISHNTLIINNPTSIRNLPEKFIPLYFPELSPQHLLTSSVEVILEFLDQHKKIVIKPLYQYGGQDVTLITEGDAESQQIISAQLQKFGQLLIHEFLPEVLNGDKRIIIIDGEIFGAYRRIPPQGEFRANAAVGGQAKPYQLNTEDYYICNNLRPMLKKHDLFFVGIDIIGTNLIEVNTTSPTGLTAINMLYNSNIERKIVNVIENKIDNWYKQLA